MEKRDEEGGEHERGRGAERRVVGSPGGKHWPSSPLVVERFFLFIRRSRWRRTAQRTEPARDAR